MRPDTEGFEFRAAKKAVLILFICPTRTADEFAAAVRADGVHLLGTARAKCALVAADIDFVLCDKRSATFFTHSFHLQGHLFSFRLKPFR